MNTLLGLPLWLWVVAAAGLLAATVYFVRNWLRQVRARKAIDNVISSTHTLPDPMRKQPKTMTCASSATLPWIS